MTLAEWWGRGSDKILCNISVIKNSHIFCIAYPLIDARSIIRQCNNIYPNFKLSKVLLIPFKNAA